MNATVVNNKDVRIAVRDLLRNNLDDPISARSNKGKHWIYEDYPRQDATLPRIGMQDVSDTFTPLSIGTATQVSDTLIQVTIMLKEEGNKFDVDGDGTPEKEEDVLAYFKEKVKDIIEDDDNQDMLRNNIPVRYFLPVDASTSRPEGENTLKVDITCETEYV